MEEYKVVYKNGDFLTMKIVKANELHVMIKKVIEQEKPIFAVHPVDKAEKAQRVPV